MMASATGPTLRRKASEIDVASSRPSAGESSLRCEGGPGLTNGRTVNARRERAENKGRSQGDGVGADKLDADDHKRTGDQHAADAFSRESIGRTQ